MYCVPCYAHFFLNRFSGYPAVIRDLHLVFTRQLAFLIIILIYETRFLALMFPVISIIKIEAAIVIRITKENIARSVSNLQIFNKSIMLRKEKMSIFSPNKENLLNCNNNAVIVSPCTCSFAEFVTKTKSSSQKRN